MPAMRANGRTYISTSAAGRRGSRALERRRPRPPAPRSAWTPAREVPPTARGGVASRARARRPAAATAPAGAGAPGPGAASGPAADDGPAQGADRLVDARADPAVGQAPV